MSRLIIRTIESLPKRQLVLFFFVVFEIFAVPLLVFIMYSSKGSAIRNCRVAEGLRVEVLRSESMRIITVLFIGIAGAALLQGMPAYSAEMLRKGLTQTTPEAIGLQASRLNSIDNVVARAIKAGELPGAVVLVARHGQIAYFKAFGNRSVRPKPEPMTVDTIFDLSSLTKVAATTPSIMLLVENGTLRLEDKVKRYLPKFSGGGKDNITLRQLLTHYSGLQPDFDLSREWFGYLAALEELWKIKTVSDPGKEFAYSDLNFIALGEIVHAVTGEMLDVFAREHVFVPLDMKDTCFCPSEKMRPRIAPTETRRSTLKYLKGQSSQASLDVMLRGEVHDPTAWLMGGVAGHAGLFSSAQDLAIYAQMLLDRGVYPGGRLLSSTTIQAMTGPQSPDHATQIRGYGWDIESSYSSPRGDIFTKGYGHTGFSGTSMWIHPPTETFIVILSNRVHPDGGKDINHLRGAIANIVAGAISDPR
jgi:CubicO group peptidase (beta-lactamase class C family)